MISAELSFEFANPKIASVVDKALSPDNIDLPKGMKIGQVRKGSFLQISIAIEAERGIETMISTLDEFVSHVHSALSALEHSRV
ncbi:MAG: KEOPS complex subunit Pcc1 [Nitrososphaerales archaeon]